MYDSFATPQTVAHQDPLSMGFPRQEYWPRLPFPSPEDLPDPGIQSESPVLAVGFSAAEPPAILGGNRHTKLLQILLFRDWI